MWGCIFCPTINDIGAEVVRLQRQESKPATSRRQFRLGLPGLALAVVAGVSSLSVAQSEDEPTALRRVAEADPDVLPPLRYRVIPDDPGPPSKEAELEQRLAALASAVEARARAGILPDGFRAKFGVEELGTAVQDVLSEIEDRAALSVHVRDLASNQVLFDYYGDTPLIPASNQKLLTSSAALDLLGPDYTFTTRIVRGDHELIMVGEGDPVLDTDDLVAMAHQVINQVDLAEVRRIVVDDSAFSPERFGPGYSVEGPGYAYQAPSGALSVNFNTIEVVVYPVRGSRELAVRVEPDSDHIVIDNHARRGRRRSVWVGTRARGDKTVVEVHGTMTRRSRPVVVRRRVAEPAAYTGETFAAILAELTTSEPLPVESGVAPASASEVLVRHESPPLIETLDSGLAYSNNFIAEQVLRTVAWSMTGAPGDWGTGKRILQNYWSALGGDPGALVVENASGLSRQGRVTTHGLVDLIAVANRLQDRGASLIDALPVAGEEGTLRSRLRLSGKRVRAKTGTLDGVSGLTGVITAEDGTPEVAFSILINVDEDDQMYATTRRRVEDRIVMELLQALDDYEMQRSGLTDPPRQHG